MRGLLLRIALCLLCLRYNPACAGTTAADRAVFAVSAIQPRVCGDYDDCIPVAVDKLDTTPRVRGLHLARLYILLERRYNPACAGTT